MIDKFMIYLWLDINDINDKFIEAEFKKESIIYYR